MNWILTGWDQAYSMVIHHFEEQYALANRRKDKNVLARYIFFISAEENSIFIYLVASYSDSFL